MMKKLYVLLLLAVFSILHAAPAVPLIRVEIIGDLRKVKLTNFRADKKLKIEHPKDHKARRFFNLRAVGKPDPAGKWTKHEISFVPDKYGEVTLFLRGNQHKNRKKVVWTLYDKLEIEGAQLFNPSFEKVTGKTYRQWESNPCHLRENFPGAPDGKNVAASTHDYPIKQQFTVRKGVRVTIRFMARAGEETKRPVIKRKRVIYSNQPADHYRFSNSKVKYLRLSDKGIKGSDISEWTPWLRPECPPDVTIADVKKGAAGSKAEVIPFELLEENGVARTANVRFGMPFPRSSLRATDCLKITDPRGKAVPAQFKAISFWQDKSIKFLLIDFNADLKAKEKSIWKLHTATAPAVFKSNLKYTETDDGFTVSTGRLTAKISKKKFALLQDVRVDGKKIGSFSANGIELTDEHGKLHSASGLVPEKVRVEEAGPLRLVIRIDGKYTGRIASYTARMIFRADSPVVDFSITHINTNLKNEFTDIESLKLVFNPAVPAKNISMDGAKTARIFQHHDRKLEINGKFSKKLMSGAGTAGNITFSMRDAALRYPKAFSVSNGKIAFELLPKQPDAKFGTDLPWHLFFPLCEGFYRLKWGMGFTEELKIDFSGKSSPAALNAMAVIPVIDTNWLFKTDLFPGIPSGKVNRFAQWDKKAVEAFYSHMKTKAIQREYGFLNYGDWFGERGRNWTNNEYDLAHGLFMLFLRTGNRDTFRWAQLAARHQADVDIIKAYPDPMFIGANAQHGIGHTGISYQRVNPAAWSHSFDYSYLGRNGHTWSEGMIDAWLLGGDIIPMEASLLLCEHLVTYTAPLLFNLSTHERSAGWSSIALMGIYRATGDPRCREAIDLLLGLIHDEQKFDLGGVWPHRLPGAHSGGHKDSFGNCPYLVGILLRSLRDYYVMEPRPETAKAIVAAANWLSRCFSSEHVGWSYGVSWDGKNYHAPGNATNMIIVPGMMAGGRLSNNRKIYDQTCLILDYSTLAGVSAVGKTLSISLCMMPILFDEINRYCAANPDIKPYAFNPEKTFIHQSKGINKLMRLRGPDKKEMVVKASSPTVLNVRRKRHGSRTKGKPEFTFSVRNAAGKTIFSAKDKVRATKTWQVRLPAAGSYTINIDDDWSGFWDADGKNCLVYAKIVKDYDFVNASISRQYLTVPAGTDSFDLEITGVHAGGCIGFLLTSDDKIIGSASNENSGLSQLPWIGGPKKKHSNIRVKLDKPLEKAECWKLVTFASGDVKLNIRKFQGYLSLVPVPFEK